MAPPPGYEIRGWALPGVSIRERVLERTIHENAYWSHVVVPAGSAALATGRGPLVSTPRRQCVATPDSWIVMGGTGRTASIRASELQRQWYCSHTDFANAFVPVARRSFAQGGLPCDWYRSGAQCRCNTGRTLAAPLRLFATALCYRSPTGRPPATVRYGTVLPVAHWPAPCDCSLRHCATGRPLAVPCDCSLQGHHNTSRKHGFPRDWYCYGNATPIVAHRPFALTCLTCASATGIATARPHLIGQVARGPFALMCLTRASATGRASGDNKFTAHSYLTTTTGVHF